MIKLVSALLHLSLISSVAQAVFTPESNAGIQVRMVKSIIKKMKNAYLEMSPIFFDFDINLDESMSYELPFNNSLEISNIQYDIIRFDLREFNFDFIQFERTNMISIELPLFKRWTLSADYKFEWAFLFPLEGKIYYEFNGIGVASKLGLLRTSTGQLDPMVRDLQVQFGKTYLDIGDDYYNWLFNQLINIGKVIAQNSVNIFGYPTISSFSQPTLEAVLSNYQYAFTLNSTLLEKKANFTLDYRLTDDPLLTNEFLELYFFGELNHNEEKCTLPNNPKHEFKSNNDFLQVIITERMVNCFFQAMENSPFTEFVISSENMQKWFNTSSIQINARTINQFIPQFTSNLKNDS